MIKPSETTTLPPDTNAWPQDLQAAFWEQTPQVPHAPRVGGRSSLNTSWLNRTWTWVRGCAAVFAKPSVSKLCIYVWSLRCNISNSSDIKNVIFNKKSFSSFVWSLLIFSNFQTQFWKNKPNCSLTVPDTQRPRTKHWNMASEGCWRRRLGPVSVHEQRVRMEGDGCVSVLCM